jgi:hypothetical protein
MITIKVGGTPLYIPEDTTLVLEQHNNSFDIDNIASDIIWTFDLPGKPNAVALDHAQYVNISNHKRYRCEISFNGVVISNGYLYIQGVTDETTISCGVVLDGLGQDGWGERKLKENDYGADVQISPVTATLDEHRQNWINFLTGSLSADSIYKFFLFCCERFYKNNEAFGYHQNQWSAIVGHDEDKTFAKYVNRLFYGNTGILTPNWQVMNTSDEVANGLKLFNTPGTDTDKTNGYCFAPAIRLDWLVRKVFASAGYNVTGNFLSNDYIKKLYIQSMNAMDGNMAQFQAAEEFVKASNLTGTDSDIANDNNIDLDIGELSYNAFQLTSGNPSFDFQLDVDTTDFVHQSITPTQAKPWTMEEDVVMLLIRTEDAVNDNLYPCYRAAVSTTPTNRDFKYGTHTVHVGTRVEYIVTEDNNEFSYTDIETGVRINYDHFVVLDEGVFCVQLSYSQGDQGANYPSPSPIADIVGSFTTPQLKAQGNINKKYVVELARFKVRTVQHGTWDGNISSITHTINLPATGTGYLIKHIQIQKYGQLEELEYQETLVKTGIAHTNNTRNVFDIAMRWREHVPNVSNADFIKKLCRFFGLSFYINPIRKEVQLSFINNVFNAGDVDITPYVINSERLAYDPKHIEVSMDTVLSTKDMADNFHKPDVDKRADLPQARMEQRQYRFVTNENAYNLSEQEKASNQYWKYEWVTAAGNNHKMIIGKEGDTKEDVTADISVPNMKVVDTQGTPKYLCDIETNGNSKLMDDDYTGDFDMILQQYKGLQTISLGLPLIGTFKIETANPTCYDKNGNVSDDYLTLAATGRNSVGEKFLRRFYEFQADRENYRFTAKLPVDVFLKVYQMQMPQTAVGQQEKRWIMVQHRRYIPTTVSYEFGHGNYVLATIECARRHYETD